MDVINTRINEIVFFNELIDSNDDDTQNNESVLKSYDGDSQINEGLSQIRLEINNELLMQVNTNESSFYTQALPIFQKMINSC